jgi:N6-adenosine-specific RNA methylase IME4
MIHLPAGPFSVIMADPPWAFATRSDKGLKKSPQAHYDCMSLDAIKALPVADISAPDCLLMMWATAPMLPHALEVMAAWGFTYKTMGAWAKRSKTGSKWAFGTGYILRSASEPFLIGTRGAPRVVSKSERNLIVAPVREHSRKPDEARAMLERMIPAGRRLEMFARETAPGWEAWGNQVGRFDHQPKLEAAE